MVRVTAQTLQVLSVLLDDTEVPMYGLELVRATNLKSGTVYPILSRLEEAGWLESRWEADPATDLGRPRRRLYRLSGVGVPAARTALEDHLRAIAPGRTRTRAALRPKFSPS